MVKKQWRSWDQIVKEEGAIGAVMGGTIKEETAWRKNLLNKTIRRKRK